jgi:hypothetical protein
MSKLNPEKLSVEFVQGVTSTEPIIPRRYTLTHSDITAELFLTIGLDYAYDKISAMRDEVLGEWVYADKQYYYQVYLHVDGRFGPAAVIRNQIFIRELPLALEAIRYGDNEFFSMYAELNHVPILVYFISANPDLNRIENWGTFSNYEISSSQEYNRTDSNSQNTYLLDMKIGDVTGDGITDKVYLYGYKPDGAEGIFADNITVAIEDGQTNEVQTITPEFNSGYNAGLFLGDFTKNNVADIKVSIEAGGSGGYGYHYIYSFVNYSFKEIFNFDKYNMEYKYKVDYADLYKVDVGNVMLNKLFVLDISCKGYDYVSQYYDENGKLINPVQGEVLALSSLFPIITDEKSNTFDILAIQRIIGTTNSDTLGFIENLLSWNSQEFVSKQMFATLPGTNLISLLQP